MTRSIRRSGCALVAIVGLAQLVAPSLGQEAVSSRGRELLQDAMQVQLNASSLADLEQAMALSERALREGLDKDDAELAHNIIASCLYQRANGYASAVIGRNRPHPRWMQLREIALNDLEKAVEHVPNLAEAYTLIYKLCLLPGGDRERGLKACNEAIRLYADNRAELAEAYMARARFQEKPEDQLADLEKAAELEPESREAKQLRAAMLFDQKKYLEAAEAFERLIQEDETNPAYHLARAEALSNIEGRTDEAFAEIARALELDPNATNAYLLRARLHASKENVDAALEDLGEILKRNPNDLTALLFRAELYLFKDDTKAARQDVDRALQAQPGLILGILLRSRIHAAEKRYEDAIRDMEVLIQNDPRNIDYRLQLALYYNADDRPRKAIKVLTDVLEQDKDNWRALRSRGDALLSIGKHAEAIKDFNRAYELNPNDSGLLNNLAWVLATSPDDELRDGKRALELATKACELTGYKEAHILSTLASAYAELGDFETAKKWSAKAVELGEGEVKEQLKKELESYEQSKPWRERQETKEKPDIPRKNLLET